MHTAGLSLHQNGCRVRGRGAYGDAVLLDGGKPQLGLKFWEDVGDGVTIRYRHTRISIPTLVMRGRGGGLTGKEDEEHSSIDMVKRQYR